LQPLTSRKPRRRFVFSAGHAIYVQPALGRCSRAARRDADRSGRPLLWVRAYTDDRVQATQIGVRQYVDSARLHRRPAVCARADDVLWAGDDMQ
jgi:hypothetical protein